MKKTNDGKGKPKKTGYATLQRKADFLQSQYIRRKAAKDGMCTCVSCGKSLPWQEMDAGHFIAKSRGASIRYVEENVHPECRACNRFDDGHLAGYTLYMIDMYGREKIDELRLEAKKVLSQSEKYRITEEAFHYYSTKLKEIE